MPLARFALVLILSLVVSTQPMASVSLACNAHTDEVDTHISSSHEHIHGNEQRVGMRSPGETLLHFESGASTVGSDHCDQSGTECKCHQCGQFVGIIFQLPRSVTLVRETASSIVPLYIEPPDSRAIRPPILI